MKDFLLEIENINIEEIKCFTNLCFINIYKNYKLYTEKNKQYILLYGNGKMIFPMKLVSINEGEYESLYKNYLSNLKKSNTKPIVISDRIYLWFNRTIWKIDGTEFVYINEEHQINSSSSNKGIYLKILNGIMPVDSYDTRIDEIINSYELAEELK